ncbi:MAG: ribonuclease R [Erysipelotrichaceae bacterium]|nr:ribonuclease R [Erysipelotrichaceae bacterium]
MKKTLIQLLTEQQSAVSLDYIKQELQIQTKDEFTALMKQLNTYLDNATIVQTNQNQFLLLEHSNYIKGTLRINRKGFGFVDGDDSSVYIHEKNLNGALDQDLVLARVWNLPNGGSEGAIERILENKLKYLVGNIRKRNGKFVFLPDSETITQTIHVTNWKNFPLVDGHKVVCKILSYGSTLTVAIESIIGHVNDPGVDIQGILLEHDIHAEFPKEVMKQLEQIPMDIPEEEYNKRKDLTKRTIITIDGDDAKDLDDAISIKRLKNGAFRLGVHIADVSYYVTEHSPLDQEAYNRSTSVYVVDRVVPMLPHILSNGVCSLQPKVNRLTISCEMDIDTEGNVFHYQIFPSIICSTERMTYNNVNRILSGDYQLITKYKHIYDSLIAMAQLSEIIRQKRKQKGSIDFDTREAKIILNDKGKVSDIKVRERGIAERMIEDFMITANECVAKHMKWLEYPCVYRIHEQPSLKKMREFVRIAKLLGYPWNGGIQNVYPKQFQELLENSQNSIAYPVLSTSMLKAMSKARYDRNCIGHFGLALNEYLHFTSPIRRYPDLIVHRMLRKYGFDQCIDTEQLENDILLMDDIADQTSLMERNAVDAEREVEDMKKAEYMESQVGKIFTGIISGITNFGIFVELPNTIEGLIHVSELKDDYYSFSQEAYAMIGERTKKMYRMGQKVKVKCIKASRFQKSVDFIFVGKDEKTRNGKSYRRKPKSKA